MPTYRARVCWRNHLIDWAEEALMIFSQWLHEWRVWDELPGEDDGNHYYSYTYYNSKTGEETPIGGSHLR